MKAPDKIYIDDDIIPFNSINERLSDKDVEYIRKNALMEWANNMKRICKGAEPIEKAYQTMIDKLNEM